MNAIQIHSENSIRFDGGRELGKTHNILIFFSVGLGLLLSFHESEKDLFLAFFGLNALG